VDAFRAEAFVAEPGAAEGSPLAGRRFHMMGIGGAGVSALAQLAAAWGARVSGCDTASSRYGALVQGAGISVTMGHDPDHVDGSAELIVSSAVPRDHPERLRAAELGSGVLLRGELLAEFTRIRDTVVVAGAHGKSTTTAMICHAAVSCGVDVSMALGATLPTLGGNMRAGSSPWFVVEGDESDRTLAGLSARIAVVTNIELDHHANFAGDGDIDELYASWLRSLGSAAQIVAGPGERITRVLSGVPGSVVRFGEDEARLVRLEGSLPVPGRHNALNADAALHVLGLLDVSEDAALEALTDFPSVGRRYQEIGQAGGVRVVDDYAHHPTEVAAAIQAARTRATAGGRVVAIFQPHLYSRTQALWSEFADALTGADRVLLLPIYGAREAAMPGVTSELIAGPLRERAPGVGGEVLELAPATGDPATIVGELMDGDLVITMGAGDVTELAPRLVQGLGSQEGPAWLEQRVPLRKFTTIGTGGEARWFARVETEAQLQQALSWAAERELPFAMLGLGSNTLIADEGFRGLALRLTGELAAIEIDEARHEVRCGGGASLAAIVRRCRDAGLTGFEFACAIPGTIGGAVKMNAGAYGGEMVDVLGSVRIVAASSARDADPAELDMRYRHSAVRWDEVVAGASLKLGPDEPDAIKARVKQMQGRRSDTQPRAARSFGSVFRNPLAGEGSALAGEPPPGAGALVERAGLKGHEIGGARISPKHGNFIENHDSGSTQDVVALITLARDTVLEQFGVTLHTEVHMLTPSGYRPLFPAEVAP